MRNAKDEFIAETNGKSILCAEIKHSSEHDDDRRGFALTVGYTEGELVLFLQSLEFEYSDGYGGQELYGTIWYKDGTWSERGEYDGSEWWEYKSCPPISEICAPKKNNEA